jgi:hypothetical protein
MNQSRANNKGHGISIFRLLIYIYSPSVFTLLRLLARIVTANQNETKVPAAPTVGHPLFASSFIVCILTSHTDANDHILHITNYTIHY